MTNGGHVDPAVTPRLALSIAAAIAALAGPLPLAPVVTAAAAFVIARRGDGPVVRGAGWTLIGLSLGTMVLTPLWLHLLADVPLRTAVEVAAAFAVRLGAVLASGFALGVAVRPRTWIAATRRWPTVGLALALTVRQVPELAADAARIRLAQRARGLHLGWGAWRPRAVAIPLVQRGLDRADRLAHALTLAGWGSKGRRPLRRTRFAALDLAWVALAVGLLAASGLLGIKFI